MNRLCTIPVVLGFLCGTPDVTAVAPAVEEPPPAREDHATVVETGPAAVPWDLLQQYRYRQVVSARRGFEAILADRPEDPLALAGLAASFAIGTRYTWETGPETLAEADEMSRRAVDLKPDRVETQFARALVEILLLEFGAAENRSRGALDLAGPAQAARFSLGEALLHQGKWGEAEDVFRDALRHDPDSCPATAGLSDALRQQDRFQEAIEATDNLLGNLPDCYPAQLSRAATAHRGRHGRYALRLQKFLLQEYPESRGLTTLNAAAMIFADGRYAQALAAYQSLELPPGSRYLRLLHDIGTAECEIRVGRLTEAGDRLRGFIAGFPPIDGGEHLRARLLFPAFESLAGLYRGQGQRGEEIAVLEQAGAEPDVPVRLLRLLGDAYDDLGLGSSALAVFDRAAHSDRFQSVHERGNVLIRWLHERHRQELTDPLSGSDLALIRDFEQQVQRDGGNAAAYSLARTYALTGQPSKSIAWLERAVEAGFRNIASLNSEPDLDQLRSHRKFQRLIRGLESGNIETEDSRSTDPSVKTDPGTES